MNVQKWLKLNTADLSGKVVAITGSTGGLGVAICRHLASLNASVLTLDRNPKKSFALKCKLAEEFPNLQFESIKLDLDSILNVKEVCAELQGKKIDYLILNAGVYNVPLVRGDTGYNNVFQVNFVSQYYLVKGLMPTLKRNRAKVIAVGSIAHNYAKINQTDVDFSRQRKASKIYGNSKRFLMFSLYQLFKDEQDATLAVAHPGVTLTNMTNHYPKAINWFVKLGVRLLFPSPEQASLSVVSALFTDVGYHQWIGPSRLNVWGKPKRAKLKTCSQTESQRIFEIAEDIVSRI